MIARLRVRDLIGMSDRQFELLVGKPLPKVIEAKPIAQHKPTRRTVNIEIVEPSHAEEMAEV